ncbi:enoyl-CoA hydratase/isomerase family protein, partial [Bordetella pertussis]|uniref:enoyl-CoA hydratase/isomerase family protein n=1 Tax=Bordetella pertussis TaxID=520 RepID=UPI000A78C428
MNSLLTERDAAVLTLTINRPERRNALDTATYDALAAQLRAADADTGLAAVILTGAGDHFTAGNDLRDFQAERAAGDSPCARPPNGCCKGAPSTRPRRMPPGCSPASP